VYRAFHNVLCDYKHLYGLNTKCLRRTHHTVVFDIESSLAAVPVVLPPGVNPTAVDKYINININITSDSAENWPKPVRHLQPLMDDHLISACTDTQFQ
jgi:hypothetical protein